MSSAGTSVRRDADGNPVWTFRVTDALLQANRRTAFPKEVAAHLGCKPGGLTRVAVENPAGCRKLKVCLEQGDPPRTVVLNIAEPLMGIGASCEQSVDLVVTGLRRVALRRSVASRHREPTGEPEDCDTPARNSQSNSPQGPPAPWCSPPTPLLPRWYLVSHGEEMLPQEFTSAYPVAQRIRDLESFWEHHDKPVRADLARSLRHMVQRLLPPKSLRVLPPSLDLDELDQLPLAIRTHNCVRRGLRRGSLTNGTVGELMQLPNFGIASLLDLMCVLEAAERHRLDLRKNHGATPIGDGNRASTTAPEAQEMDPAPVAAVRDETALSALVQNLRDFASWAVAETDARTFGQAVDAKLTEADEWRSLSTFSLSDIVEPPPHPYVVLSKWAEGLDDREHSIFTNRIAQLHGPPHTLQSLAGPLGISRERVRQVEGRVVEQLGLFVDSAAGSPIRWRINTLRDRLSVAAPRGHVDPQLVPPADSDDYRSLLLELAGPYDESDGWLVLRSAQSSDPTDAIRDMTDEFGRIEMATASAALANWGLDSGLHNDWIARDRRLRLVNGQIVRWDGPIADKLAFALADLEVPAAAERLLAHIGESRAVTSAKNAMAVDERFVRANRTEWALASWGLLEYSGIASTIGQILEGSDQPMLVDELIDRLSSDFRINEGSARSYCDAAMFVLEDGRIRLRREHEKYQYQNSEVRDAPGVFALGDGVVGLLYEVDRDVIRGSGRQLSPAAGALLDLSVNERLRFDGPRGTSVTMTFPGTSFTGPSLGSTRGLAEAVNAKMGDMLTVILRRAEMTVSARATDLNEHDAGWALVARLTGISENSGMDGLAAALYCSRGEVRATLRARKDTAVLEALPERRLTPDLEEALAALDAEMQREEPS